MTGPVVAAAYVVLVACLAALGVASDSTALILAAAALTLPCGVAAMVGFYMTVGLLSQAPGANPSGASGSGSCTAGGVCQSSSTGDAAGWFLLATDVLGVVALAAAAIVNVLLLRLAARRLRNRAIERSGPVTRE